jgi:uncharacterized protein (TIGR02246 family)
MKGPFAILFIVSVIIAGCVTNRQPAASSNVKQEVRNVLDKQAAAWNAGDLAGFMEGYARSSSTRFASGGDVLFGWETVFERYRRKYGDTKAMGKLKFSDLDIQVLGPDSALAFGRWHLTREGGDASGLYTLILRKARPGWRIVHDHTSAASP